MCQLIGNKVAEILILSGAEVDFKRKDGQTALFLAANSGCLPTFKLLLREGADCTTLSQVSYYNNIVKKIFKILITFKKFDSINYLE